MTDFPSWTQEVGRSAKALGIQSLRRIKVASAQEVITSAAILLLVIDTFLKPLSTVALGLVLVALAPWILQFVKSAELPGGFKFELREQLEAAGREADEAGLLVTAQDVATRPVYEAIFSEDPALALAGLRIEIEKRLNRIADMVLPEKSVSTYASRRPRILIETIRNLWKSKILTLDQYKALSDLLPILNQAVHAGPPDMASAAWAMDIGPRLLAGLDEIVKQAESGIWG